jgi:hypothetical protein
VFTRTLRRRCTGLVLFASVAIAATAAPLHAHRAPAAPWDAAAICIAGDADARAAGAPVPGPTPPPGGAADHDCDRCVGAGNPPGIAAEVAMAPVPTPGAIVPAAGRDTPATRRDAHTVAAPRGPPPA